MFKAQLTLSQRHKNGYRWQGENKALYMSMYYRSARLYRFLLKLKFALPSVRTLQRWISIIPDKTGWNDNVLQIMKQKFANVKPADRLCTIVFDEVSLKENLSYNSIGDRIIGLEDYGNIGQTKAMANHALVFMIRRIVSKWKQTPGYFFTKGTTPSKIIVKT
jgi:hypothetical protein